MTRSPLTAPPRTDLPWLRRRTVRPALAPPPPPPAPPTAPPAAQPEPVTPTVSASLDLSTPTAAPAPAPTKPTASSSLDLSTPAPAAPRAAAPAPAPRRAPAAPPPPAVPRRRVRPRASTVLSRDDPSVWLTRLQSGIGTLTIEAAVSDAVGDLRLGAAYRLRKGTTSVVQHASGLPEGPPRSDRPVLRGAHRRFETITVDLRQIRGLDRLAVYAYSQSGAALSWGGTLILTTYGAARVEMPLDGPAGPGVLVALTAYNVDGELVLRQEPWELATSVREACLSMGFDRITWLDPNNPVV